MNAILLSIGDELALGQTIDTNSAWLAAQLAAVGCDVTAHMTVADDQAAITRAIRRCAGECDVLLISGGLGPTEDDLTRQALADALGQPLEMNERALARLDDFFAKRGRPMPPANRVQAMIPRGAAMIENTAGTAPGIDATFHLSDPVRTCRTFVMPGVPKEMKIMFARDVIGPVGAASGGAAIVSRLLHTFGSGESAVAQKLGDLMDRKRNPSVGTTVSNGIVSLRVNSRFGSVERATAEADRVVAECRAALGFLIFGENEETLAQVVAQSLLAASSEHPRTVTTAESCTGGSLAKMLTDLAGSSAYFQQGWVTYSNEAKTDLLGVPAATLAEHGAVSEPVAAAMATGARERAKATYALAVSGVAGPGGGTVAKPVGTVCIGLAAKPTTAGGAAHVQTRTFQFSGDREFIRDRSAKMALTMLRYHMAGEPLTFA